MWCKGCWLWHNTEWGMWCEGCWLRHNIGCWMWCEGCWLRHNIGCWMWCEGSFYELKTNGWLILEWYVTFPINILNLYHFWAYYSRIMSWNMLNSSYYKTVLKSSLMI